LIPRSVLALLFCSATVASGQGVPKAASVRQVTGVVTDSVGAPLIRATVFVPDSKLSATTDSTGHYHLTGVPTTPFSVRAAASGFRPKQVDGVQVRNADVTLDFVLYPFIEEPRPLPVASSRLPR
jgi:hypothetical protein